jgi:hypothetical protein
MLITPIFPDNNHLIEGIAGHHPLIDRISWEKRRNAGEENKSNDLSQKEKRII